MGKHSKPAAAGVARTTPPGRRGGKGYVVAIVIAVLSTLLALAAVGAMVAWKAGVFSLPFANAVTSEHVADTDASTDDARAAVVTALGVADNVITNVEKNEGLVPAPDTRADEFAVRAGDAPGTSEPSGQKVLYLTFDDGPSRNTQRVLDILDQYHAKATFFVTGADPDYAYMIHEAYDRGHTIGMHTYTHDYAQVYASVDAYFADLDSIAAVVSEQIGYVPAFIRFPGGSSNTISANYTRGIMSTLAPEVQARGFQYYDWDASCGDGADHTADEVLYYATEGSAAVGMQNVIMLLHDSSAKDSTVEALPQIIEYWQAQGYELCAIDRSTRYSHHGIGN